MVADGWTAELQATVVHRRLAPTVAGYALAAITATLVSTGWPTVGGVLAVSVLLGGIADLAGGRSWVRHLTPRRGHRNVLLWADEKPPDPAPGPWPGGTPGAPHRRQVLLLIPDHPAFRTMSWGTGLGALFGAVAVASIVGSQLTEAATAMALLAGTAAGLVAISLLAMAVDRRPARPKSARGVAAARAIVDALPTSLVPRVGIVVIGSMEPWFDGIEVLLRSRRRRMPPTDTDVVVWHPGPGPVRVVTADGVFRRAPARVLVEAMSAIPPMPPRWWRPWRTGALRARGLGWSAVGLVGGGNDPESIRTLAAAMVAAAERSP